MPAPGRTIPGKCPRESGRWRGAPDVVAYAPPNKPYRRRCRPAGRRCRRPNSPRRQPGCCDRWNGHALRKSTECTNSPVNWLSPGHGGMAGVRYRPVASTTADVRMSPCEVSTRQPCGCALDAVTSQPSASRDVLLPDVAVEVSDHVLLGRPAAGAERNPLSGKMGQISHWCSDGSCRSGCATTSPVRRLYRRRAPKCGAGARARARRPGRRARLRR